ncbi:MAG: hypothetical protein WAO09_03900 [Candidatus Dormiibacterota bacterium]
MGPSEFETLPLVPALRLCGCGQRTRWSHLQYLGSGRSAPVHVCIGCGRAFRGGAAEESPRKAAPRSRKPLPAGGPPDNPVLDQQVAAKLRALLSDPDS